MPEYAKQVNKACKACMAKYPDFNAYSFVQRNRNSHPNAIISTLDGMVSMKSTIKNYYAISVAILKTENGKESEALHLRKKAQIFEEEKELWKGYVDNSDKLKQLIRGIG